MLYAEIGSPWRVPLSRLENFVVMPPFTMQDPWFLTRIWIYFRKHSPKPYFCKTGDQKEWSNESKAFSISTVTRNPFFFKILAVLSKSYFSFALSLMYLFFTYVVWLDEVRSGNMSFNRVVNAFEIHFRSVFSKDIGLWFSINFASFSSINFIGSCFWEVIVLFK